MRSARARRWWPCLALLLLGCGLAASPSVIGPAPLEALESRFALARSLHDAIDVTRSRGTDTTATGEPLAALVERYARAREELEAALRRVRVEELATDDRRAFARIESVLAGELAQGAVAPPAADTAAPRCDYDAAAMAASPEGRATLAERVYACYGRAAQRIEHDGRILDRLTILSELPRTPDSAARRRLFLALDPVWRSMNGANDSLSPYRQLVRLDAPAWRAGRSPVAQSIRDLGIHPTVMQQWLTAILAKWRDVGPEQMLEPWDYYHAAGEASRALSSRIAAPSDIVALNERVFADLGASPAALGFHYDLLPRPGKTPVAFTTFGARRRREGDAWRPTEPWVFATYRVGGLDNLGELLHETGHAIHIAAIRTRPAFTDWPDSDPFTEALGDLVALDVYEPVWQMRYLGDSVTVSASLRAKYASIVLDIAWALFEMRMHADPDRDPNTTWTDITREYLRIVPHPELSWWAMRGQLVHSPGYMANYAIGSIIVADLRARASALRGPLSGSDSAWYAWTSERLYRFGLERSSRDVITSFLGRPVSPLALLDDLSRIRRPGSP